MNIAPKIVKLVAYLNCSYRNFKLSSEETQAWQAKLGGYSPEVLLWAADRAMERSPQFAPPLPLVVSMIEGKVVEVPVHATDNWCAVIHPPRKIGTVEIRVYPGEPAPSWVPEGTPPKPMKTPDEVHAMVTASAQPARLTE